MHVGDAGASALAAALDRGALPRLEVLVLTTPPSATRRWRPSRRPCGGGPRWRNSASVATRSATRASPPSWRRRRRCRHAAAAGWRAEEAQVARPRCTQVTDAGCATLAAALDSGALPALDTLHLDDIPASGAARRRAASEIWFLRRSRLLRRLRRAVSEALALARSRARA